MPFDHVLDELAFRGLLKDCTDADALRAHLREPRRVYCGFDPTADSLTIGNLVPMMILRCFQRHGHTPVVLMGGATGRIGDPSGKEAERALRGEEEIDANIESQRHIFERVLRARDGMPDPVYVNNFEWFKDLSFIHVLRDIGKHFSVNEMIRRDSVRDRLDREQGLSYTEFSYMLLQAYDFLYLFREMDVTVQAAGSDQWGNIVSGTDLIRRTDDRPEEDRQTSRAFGLTAPLVTKADGSKFGKTESGAIWLSHKRPSHEPGTSPYAMHQFWLNASDADAIKWLRIFTEFDRDRIEGIEREHAEAPQQRAAQRALADSVTSLIHGEEATRQAEAAAAALFKGDVAGLDRDTLEDVFAEVASTEHSKAELDGEGVPYVELLPATTLCSSKREARDFLKGGSVTVNGNKVGLDDALHAGDLLHDEIALIRRGKKTWHVTRWR